MEFRRSPKKRRLANMGFWSGFGSSAAGGLFSNIASLNRSTHRSGWGYAIDPLGGLMGKAFLDDDKYQDARSLAMASALTAMQYDYAIRGMKEGPSAAKEGLIAAGYNPMLAIGSAMSPASVSVGNQSPKDSAKGSPIDIASAASALASARQSREMTEVAKDTAKVNNAATTANSAADVALKTAQAEKIRKESDSIEPDIIKRHNRYGTSSFGRAIEDVTLKLSDALDTNRRLREAKSKLNSSSAKGLDRAVKVISDEMHREEKRRGDAVRKRRAWH